jgi:L-ascorbate metabolism protein UlaG (beta-lactamase superfamily)
MRTVRLPDIANDQRWLSYLQLMSLPPSDHFNGKTFFYPGERTRRGLLDVLKWKLTSRAARWPQHVAITPPPLPPKPTIEGVVATWIGHATFLLQTPTANILVDPVFSDRVSPFSWIGPRRVHAPGIALHALPRIDLVLLSHDHYDHCDFATLRHLAQHHRPRVLAPLGHRALLASTGLTDVVELDWWQSHAPDSASDGTPHITLTPSRHWCRRRPGDANVRLWGGFLIRAGGRLIYFLGDSGYDDALFREIGRRGGAPDLALIPIGAYAPRWFMRSAHMNPTEAVQVHRDVGAKRSLAMHWGTFQLTDEARDEPVAQLVAARTAAGLDPLHFQALTPGESVAV